MTVWMVFRLFLCHFSHSVHLDVECPAGCDCFRALDGQQLLVVEGPPVLCQLTSASCGHTHGDSSQPVLETTATTTTTTTTNNHQQHSVAILAQVVPVHRGCCLSKSVDGLESSFQRLSFVFCVTRCDMSLVCCRNSSHVRGAVSNPQGTPCPEPLSSVGALGVRVASPLVLSLICSSFTCWMRLCFPS